MNAKKIGRAALLAAGGLAAAWLFCAFLLPACGPFVIGALVAWAAELSAAERRLVGIDEAEEYAGAAWMDEG